LSDPIPFNRDNDVIDVTPGRPRRRRRWWIWIVVALVLFLFVSSRGLSIYMSALWFGSLGYSQFIGTSSSSSSSCSSFSSSHRRDFARRLLAD
jgi:hypothetical protein